MFKNKLPIIVLILLFQNISSAQISFPDTIQNEFEKGLSSELIDDLIDYSADVYNSSNTVENFSDLLDTIQSLSREIDYKYGLAKVYSKYATYYNNKNLFDSSNAYSHKAILLLDKSLHFDEWFGNYTDMVETFVKYHQIDSALLYANEIVDAVKSLDDSLKIAIAYSVLGKVHTNNENYTSAIDALKIAEEYYPKDSHNQLAIFYNSMGITYFMINKYELSRVAYFKSMEYDRLSDDIDIRNSIYNNLGRLYHMGFKDLDSSIYYYEKGLALYDEDAKSEPLSYYINLGNVFLENGNNQKAKEYYLKAYNSKSLNTSPIHNAAVTINIGIVLKELNNLKESEVYLKNGLELAKKHNLIEFQRNAYINLSELSLKLGRINELDVYKDSVISFTKQIWDDRLNDKVADLEANIEFEKLTSENALLAQEKELNTKKLFYYNIIMALIALLLIVLIVFIVLIRKSKHKVSNINNLLIEKNRELEDLNSNLNSLNRTKDKFFSIIAHDLKGPIGSTSQLLAQLEENFDIIDKKTQLGIIASLKKTGVNTFNLLENLLDWAKTQKSEFKNNPEEFDLVDVVDEVFNVLNTRAKNKNQYLINLIEKQKYIVYADRKMLIAILINLLNNSIKFSEIGKRIFVKAKEINNKVELIVEDEGVGIPEEFKEKLFDLSTEQSAIGTQNEKGTGLGLVLIHEFAKIMNTDINLIKSDEKGTIFSVKLMLAK